MATFNATLRFYSRQGLWSLFLMSALPLHIWTFILTFNDFSWVTERTDSWDAVGVMAYGLIFALVESVVIFFAFAILGLLISKKWGEKRRIALLSILVTIVSLWAIAGHIYFFRESSMPPQVIAFFVGFDHPLRVLYSVALLIVVPTILSPTYFVLASDKFFRFVEASIERLSTLMILYLVVDIAAGVILLIRNI
ncbi:MAG: hypothetical protein IH589_19320 [Anaerolineales bacterium]|nr:hypothetical protein [Anaerolineales bacterium]